MAGSDPSDPSPPGALPPWWRPRPVAELLADLIATELGRLRAGAEDTEASVPGPETLLDSPLGSPLGNRGAPVPPLSSLEFIALATAVSVQFELHACGLDKRLLSDRSLRHWTETVLEGRRRDDRAICFQTSGSTGRPKVSRQAMATLAQEAAVWADLFRDRRRVLRAVPCHHIYGFLFTIMLPALLGVPVTDVRKQSPPGALSRARPGDLLVGHPAFFDLATRGPRQTPADLFAVTSTAPCPGALWRRLLEAGLTRVTEVYGATETGGIGLRQSPDAAFALLPYWSRATDDRTALVRGLPDGDCATAVAPDRLRWVGADRFQVVGRLDDALQVGGINVYPDQVRRALLAHPAVADAAVHRTDDSPCAGLEARVVPRVPVKDPAPLQAALIAWLRPRLPPAAMPRRIAIDDHLPRAPRGRSADRD